MGGSLRFMFEDLNRSRGLGGPRGGSFPAHFGAVSVLIAVVLMFNFTKIHETYSSYQNLFITLVIMHLSCTITRKKVNTKINTENAQNKAISLCALYLKNMINDE